MAKILIKCRGYWSSGQHDCPFEHLGNWDDKELHEHQDYELKFDDGKTHFWEGFEQVQIFKVKYN